MKNFIRSLQGIFTKHHVFITMGIAVLVVIIIGYGEYRQQELKRLVILQNSSLASSTSIEINSLNDKINSIVTQNNLLNSTVQNELIRNSLLADQVSQVNDTALALDKLSKVDPQLLQKYSKVYFLNENYSPGNLVSISSQYCYDEAREYQLLEGVSSYLEEMIKDAKKEGIDLKVISAYRSFGEQAILKSSYLVTYGAGTANQFSADQGYSEHQLGTTVDLTTLDNKEDFSLFDKTKAYTWLAANAYTYGFVMSYPKNNTYYTYEPWHWRFVGVDLAYKIHRQGKNFYDLDQRDINNYLGLFFD